jgi:uncharacterized membrane protein
MAEGQTPVTPAPPTQGTSGMEPNVAALVAYLGHIIGLGWLSGLIIYLIEKENKFVRFHALQSIALSVIAIVFGILWSIVIPIFIAIFGAANPMLGLAIGGIFSLVAFVAGIAFLILWIMAMIKAYNNEMYKIPIIGDFVEKYV